MTDPDHDIPDHDIHNELNRFRPRPISEALRQRIRDDVIAGGAARPLLGRSPRRHRRLIAVIATAACLAVAIRSALLRGNQARVYAGAGIVSASDPAAEWEETAAKLRWLGELGCEDEVA